MAQWTDPMTHAETPPSRRRALGLLAGGAALAGLAPRDAAAEYVCSPFYANGLRVCEAGVRIQGITARQACETWCWAACIETIFALHGYEMPQERIVEALFGQLVCAPATGLQIAWTIEGRWQDARGRQFYARPRVLLDAYAGTWSPNLLGQVVGELKAGNPLINGALGHATNITACSYVEDGWGRFELQEVILRDPWPGTPNRRRLTAQEAYGTQFVAAVDVWA